MNKTARRGSIIETYIPNGLKLVGGRAVPEQKKVRGKVYLVGPAGPVFVPRGGSQARPYVAESYTLIKW